MSFEESKLNSKLTYLLNKQMKMDSGYLECQRKKVMVSINIKRLKLYKVVLWENITINKEYNYYWVTENLTYIGWDG